MPKTRTAHDLIAQHLTDCLPVGVPSVHREIHNARYQGTGRKRVAVADLVLFDGGLATVEVFRWGPMAWGHRWTAMPGGNCCFEDGRWQRDHSIDLGVHQQRRAG